MDYSIAFQGTVLLYSCTLGLVLGAAYDVFRLLRGTDRGMAALVLDALYGLILCAAVFVFVVCILQTEFRLWQLAGMAVGTGMWFALAGAWFRRAARAAAGAVSLFVSLPVRAARRILHILRKLIKIPHKFMGKNKRIF